jgi:hypothetical protein
VTGSLLSDPDGRVKAGQHLLSPDYHTDVLDLEPLGQAFEFSHCITEKEPFYGAQAHI